MQQIKPAELTEKVKKLILDSKLTEQSLARAFRVTPDTLRTGLDGRPSVALVIGIAKATGLPLNEVAVFMPAQKRALNEIAKAA